MTSVDRLIIAAIEERLDRIDQRLDMLEHPSASITPTVAEFIKKLKKSLANGSGSSQRVLSDGQHIPIWGKDQLCRVIDRVYHNLRRQAR